MIINKASHCMLVIIYFLKLFLIFIHLQIEFIFQAQFQTLELNTSIWSGPWRRGWLILSTLNSLETFLCFPLFLAYTGASLNADFWGFSVTFPLSCALIRKSVPRSDLDFCCRRCSYTGCHGSLTQFLKVRVLFPECIPAAGSSGGHPGILHLRRGRVGS